MLPGRAEYVALTQLQADASITLGRQLSAEVAHIVNREPISAIL